MTRSLARIALVAALMVGVIAMHSFGHRGHTEESEFGGEPAVVTVHRHMAQGSEGRAAVIEAGAENVDSAYGSVASATETGSYATIPAHGSDAAGFEHGSDATVTEHGSDQTASQNDSTETAPRHGSAATALRHDPAEASALNGPVEPALSHGSDKATPEHDPASEHDPLHALSMLGFMICGGVLIRVAIEVLRKFWPRVLETLAALTAPPAFGAARTRFRYPPPLLRPTSLLLNRIAVLRI